MFSLPLWGLLQYFWGFHYFDLSIALLSSSLVIGDNGGAFGLSRYHPGWETQACPVITLHPWPRVWTGSHDSSPSPLASCKIKEQFYYLKKIAKKKEKKIATRCVLGAGTWNIKWFSPGHRRTTEPVVFSYYDNRELQVLVIWRGNDLSEFKLYLQGNSFICFESGLLYGTEANFFQLIALLPGWIPNAFSLSSGFQLFTFHRVG